MLALTRFFPVFVALAAATAQVSAVLPPGDRPIVVTAGFMLYDVSEIKESTETFEFEGALLFSWNDPRLAFDPQEEGVTERVYKGSYQVQEIFQGWRPQGFLANQSGSYERQGVVLRIEPDGTA